MSHFCWDRQAARRTSTGFHTIGEAGHAAAALAIQAVLCASSGGMRRHEGGLKRKEHTGGEGRLRGRGTGMAARC